MSDIKVFQASTFSIHILTKSINLCNDFQWMFDFPLISHRCVFYFQSWQRFSSVCSVNQRLQTKFFVKVWRSECVCPIQMEWNQWKWLTHAQLPQQYTHGKPKRNKKKFDKPLHSQVDSSKPKWPSSNHNFTCALNLFVLWISFFFSVIIFAENKVVTDKTGKREGQRQRVDRL